MSMRITHHVYIPDQQMKAGVPLVHMRWAGQYIADTFADSKATIRLVNAGDSADMESLSSYDKGTARAEGRRLVRDFAAVREGHSLFEEGLHYRKGYTNWEPDSKDLTLGNHEDRILREINEHPALIGFLGTDNLGYEDFGWTVHDFLKVVKLDGIMYSHYFVQRGTGRPVGGENIKLRIRKLGGSFVQGHEQTFDYGHVWTPDGRSMHGLVAGAFYLHHEDYLTPQGNAHWRGLVVLHDVRGGQYDVMPVSMDYLCRRYEGKRLSQFLGRH